MNSSVLLANTSHKIIPSCYVFCLVFACTVRSKPAQLQCHQTPDQAPGRHVPLHEPQHQWRGVYKLRGQRPLRPGVHHEPGAAAQWIQGQTFCLIIDNNHNNNWFLYSAFSVKIKALHKFTVYYYPGHRIQNQFCTHSAHSPVSPLPGEHSGQSPFFRRAHANSTTIPFASYQVPIYTPGSRAAMWIKWLAEGQKYRAAVGIEPGLSAWESNCHTTIPRHLHLYCNGMDFCVFLLWRPKFLVTELGIRESGNMSS